MTARTRFSSASATAACENATSDPKTCRCRCGGALHGVNVQRALAGDELRPDTWELPDDDPHFSRPPTGRALEVIDAQREFALSYGKVGPL